MSDLATYSYSSSNESGQSLPVPFLKKELLYQIDNNNSTNYSRNQVQFETSSFSNSGKWFDFREGFLSIPLVMNITRDAAHGINADDAKQLLQMKASNLSIIDSIQVEMNNNTVLQQTRNIAPLLNFKLHSTMGNGDETIHGHHMGYQKHSSTDWSYVAEEGLHNDTATSMDKKFYHEEKTDVLSVADLKAKGANCQESAGLVNTFFYDCIIRLKDLPFFEKMPLVRGSLMKITLTLNQSDTKITVTGGDKTAVVSTLAGSFCPVIRKAGSEVNDYVEDISVKVVSNNGVVHPTKNQCRLYVPAYTFENSAEQSYLGLGSKKVLYSDVFFQRLRGVNGGFQSLLTNALSRSKRLVIIPVLSATGNGTLAIEPQSSPFTADGVGTTSACRISDFNVQLSGSNVYSTNPINYSYEHFLLEQDGNDGVNGGKEMGTSSGQISLKDFESNYGYIVVDLSRRNKFDDNVPLSVQVSGTVSSAKPLDLLCYIEYEKDVTIDITTGQLM